MGGVFTSRPRETRANSGGTRRSERRGKRKNEGESNEGKKWINACEANLQKTAGWLESKARKRGSGEEEKERTERREKEGQGRRRRKEKERRIARDVRKLHNSV